MKIIEKIEEIVSIIEKGKVGWEEYPEGWKKKSVKKMGTSLTGKDPKEKGFFDKCVDKMKGKLDNPEAYCASVKDEVWSTTKWRGKGKTKSDVEKQKKTEGVQPKLPGKLKDFSKQKKDYGLGDKNKVKTEFMSGLNPKGFKKSGSNWVHIKTGYKVSIAKIDVFN